MTLRCRSYLLEANYERDKEVRSEANKFSLAFQKWYRKHPDQLKSSKDGAFYVKASKFWKHPKAKNVVVVFAPRNADGIAGGTGKVGKYDAIVFNVLLGAFDPKHLDTRLSRDLVVHELAHLLDKGFQKGKKSAGEKPKEYFNSPSEWNAYWHEGTGQIERMLSNPMVRDDEGAMEMFFGDGSFKSFAKSTGDGEFWDDRFLKNMTKKTRRKFDKRLYQLWKGLKDQGLI